MKPPKKHLAQFILAYMTIMPCGFWSTLSDAAPAPAEINFSVKKFTLEGLPPLPPETIQDYLQPLQNRSYTLNSLLEVAQGLEQIIRTKGYPFYRVSLPPQTLNGGEVKLRIVSFLLDQIEVAGNQYFSKENILQSLPGLKPGQSPNVNDLSEFLQVAHKHPSKQLAITFKESASDDQINAHISVADQRPFQATAILNTIGTPRTGDFRITAALQHSNLWGWDHILNGSYTTSPSHADQVKQYGFSYSIPWYRLGGWFNAYYAYSNVNNGTVATNLAITGSGEMYGFHYQQLLPKWHLYHQWLDIGMDNRLFNNNITFEGTPINSDVRSVPVSIQYTAEFPWHTAQFGYNIQWASNTGIGDLNDQASYSNVRTNANQNWHALRYGANVRYAIEQWTLSTTFSGQYTAQPLIAGEQLGLGGTYMIRGYQEREISADKGEILTIEMTTPQYHQASLFTFYDFGHGYNIRALAGELKNWDLHSTGVGAHWQWRKNLLATVTYAQALSDATDTQAGDSRIHATIMVRY